jgi:hypothetical protein
MALVISEKYSFLTPPSSAPSSPTNYIFRGLFRFPFIFPNFSIESSRILFLLTVINRKINP